MGPVSWLKETLFTIPGNTVSELVDVRFVEFLLTPVGLAPVLHSPRGPALVTLWAWFVVVMLTTAFVTQTAAMASYWGDLETTAMNACNQFIVLMAVCKSVGVLLPRRALADLMQRLRCRFPAGDAPGHIKVLRAAALHVRLVTFVFASPSICLIAVWETFPLLQDASERRHARADNLTVPQFSHLPMVAVYPFDPLASSLVFVATYLFQIACALFYYFIHIGVDTFYLCYIIYISAHIEVLGLCWKNIKRDTLRNLSSKQGISGDVAVRERRSKATTENVQDISEANFPFSREVVDREMYNRLVHCVRYHQMIIEFVKDFEILISPVMIIQFMNSAIIICMSGFQAAVATEDLNNTIRFGFYMITAAYQLALYCWYGQFLINESDEMEKALYEADWLNECPRFKSSLRIVMMRAQNPIRLTSAKIYTLSLDTFVKLMNTSYSCFALLRQMYDTPVRHHEDQ